MAKENPDTNSKINPPTPLVLLLSPGFLTHNHIEKFSLNRLMEILLWKQPVCENISLYFIFFPLFLAYLRFTHSLLQSLELLKVMPFV